MYPLHLSDFSHDHKSRKRVFKASAMAYKSYAKSTVTAENRL